MNRADAYSKIIFVLMVEMRDKNELLKTEIKVSEQVVELLYELSALIVV